MDPITYMSRESDRVMVSPEWMLAMVSGLRKQGLRANIINSLLVVKHDDVRGAVIIPNINRNAWQIRCFWWNDRRVNHTFYRGHVGFQLMNNVDGTTAYLAGEVKDAFMKFIAKGF